MFGDVYFSDAAVGTILGTAPHSVEWFGRSHEAKAGSHWKELFGLSFNPNQHATLTTHVKYIRKMRMRLNRPDEGGWLIYRSLQGLDLGNTFPVKHTNFTEIDDETTDFDSPEDYDEFMQSL